MALAQFSAMAEYFKEFSLNDHRHLERRCPQVPSSHGQHMSTILLGFYAPASVVRHKLEQ